ncbi:MAG: hypothetical protein ABI833_19210 [Acidobacteriota bacterium]
MGSPLARFTSSRVYVLLTLFAVGGALFSAWNALRWSPSWIAAALFGLSALVLATVTIRPAIEIHETHLAIGCRRISWRDILRVDQTGWNTPLVVILTLHDHQRIHLLYSGNPDSSSSLLRHLRRFSREALLDGVPYREFWGELAAVTRSSEPAKTPSSDSADQDASIPLRYPVLRSEDEEEVERLFQRLKSVGHLESKSSDDK